jgi:hypothetical protein
MATYTNTVEAIEIPNFHTNHIDSVNKYLTMLIDKLTAALVRNLWRKGEVILVGS